MLLTALLSVAIAAAPATAPKGSGPAPIKLAAPGLSAVNLDDKVAAFFNDHLAQQYTLRGIRVTTPSEIATLVGVERQKQLVGCSESSASCMAEIADALGVDGVIAGSLGKFGSTLQLNVKILRSSGDMLDVFSLTASSEEQLLKQISDQAAKSADVVAGKLGRGQVTSAAADASSASSSSSSSSLSSQPQNTQAPSAASSGLPKNVITFDPFSAPIGFFSFEYERVLAPAFSVFLSPQIVYLYLGNQSFVGELLVGGRVYFSGLAPDGVWAEAHVSAGAYSTTFGLGSGGLFSVAALVGYSNVHVRPWVLSVGAGLGYEPNGVLMAGESPVFPALRANVGVAF